jgi:hypothetical protein
MTTHIRPRAHDRPVISEFVKRSNTHLPGVVAMRFALSVLCAVFLASCGSDGSTSPASASVAGTYVLQTVNGSALPFVNSNGITTTTIASDIITIADAGSWSENGSSTVIFNGSTTSQPIVTAGSWSRAGATVTFFNSSQSAVYVGQFTGTGLNLADVRFNYVFTWHPIAVAVDASR